MVNTGYKQNLNFGNETRYGSSAVINQPIGLVQTINPTETNNLIKIRTLGGTRDYNNIVPGKFEISGNFDYFLQGGAFLRMGMGEDTGTTTTIDSGPKYHTGQGATGTTYLHIMGSAASPQADSFPSFTLEFADSEDTGAAAATVNLKRKYTGCRVNNLTISGSVDEPVKVAVDFIGQGVAISTAAATSVTAQTVDPYVFYQGWIYATSGEISARTSIATASRLAEVASFDLGVNNNLEALYYISGTTSVYQTSTRGLKNLLAKGRDYTSSLNMNFKNKQMYQRFLGAATATSPQATLTNYQIVLDFSRSGSPTSTPKAITDDYIRMVLRNCKFGDMNIPGGPEDVVAQTIGVEVAAAKFYVVDADASYK